MRTQGNKRKGFLFHRLRNKLQLPSSSHRRQAIVVRPSSLGHRCPAVVVRQLSFITRIPHNNNSLTMTAWRRRPDDEGLTTMAWQQQPDDAMVAWWRWPDDGGLTMAASRWPDDGLTMAWRWHDDGLIMAAPSLKKTQCNLMKTKTKFNWDVSMNVTSLSNTYPDSRISYIMDGVCPEAYGGMIDFLSHNNKC